MASAQTNICNSAIMLCGIGNEIANIQERSPEAEACRQFYDSTLERLLVKLRLPSCTARYTLDLIEDDPSDEYLFSYGVPSDMLSPIRIVSGAIPETQDSRIPFIRISKDGVQCIWTNQDDAVLEYIFRFTNETQFPPLLAEAMEYALAAKIAPRLTVDPAKLAGLVKFLDDQATQRARAAALNEIFPGNPPDSEFIRGRA